MVTIPLAPRTARAIDLAIGERTEGPVFLADDGRRLDRHGAGRIVRKVAHRAAIGKAVTPHTLRHAFITAAFGRWGPAARCAGSRLACRSAYHDAVRPGPRQPGPARHVHRRRLCRGRRPVVTYALGELRPAVTAAGRSCPSDGRSRTAIPGHTRTAVMDDLRLMQYDRHRRAEQFILQGQETARIFGA